MMGNDLPVPFRLMRRESVGSTNDEARRLAEDGSAADFFVVVADHQTSGRGRRGRTWVSPPGNLHCSILLSAPRLEVAAQLGFVASVALVDALSLLVPPGQFRCKWPNDVLLNGCKVSGMLLEPAGLGWIILGLGVDVVSAPPPDQVAMPAVALSQFGWSGDAMAVLSAFCTEFEPLVQRWRQDGFAPIRAAWLERAQGLGRPIEVRLERETLSGVFNGLDADGALILDQAIAGQRRIMAGDVFFPSNI